MLEGRRGHSPSSGCGSPCDATRQNATSLPLPFRAAAAIVLPGSTSLEEVSMGDKSPKSKQREQKQKSFAEAQVAAKAKSKQDEQSRAPQIPAKGRK
jgi:hypothetical protein